MSAPEAKRGEREQQPSELARAAAPARQPRAFPPELTSPIDEFLTTLRVEGGLARTSLAAYRSDLTRFLAWATRRGLQVWSEVDAGWIVDYLASRRDEGAAETSVARCLVSLRLLSRFMFDEGVVTRDATANLPAPSLRRILPSTLTVPEVTRLLEARGGSSWIEQRDRALLELLYATGARISEATRLEVADFEPRLRVVRLHGKGDKMRLVPVGARAREAIETWMSEGRKQVLASYPNRNPATIFVSARGRPLDRTAAWRRVKAAARAAGVSPDLSPHGLRHSFATHMIEGGADLRSVQELLGHVSVRTTEIYTHLDAEHIRGIHSLYHPRA